MRHDLLRLFVVFLVLPAASLSWAQGGRPVDPAALGRAAADLAAEERAAPTTEENVHERFGRLVGLAKAMHRSGAFPGLEEAFPAAKAQDIRRMLASGDVSGAAAAVRRYAEALEKAEPVQTAKGTAAPPFAPPSGAVPSDVVPSDVASPGVGAGPAPKRPPPKKAAPPKPVVVRLRYPESVKQLVVTAAVPNVEKGAAVGGFKTAFPSKTVSPKDGIASLKLTGTPVFIETGEPVFAPAAPPGADSFFGAHPADVKNAEKPYALATDLGLGWNRRALAAWIEFQDDAAVDAGKFNFTTFDARLRAVPKNMQTLLTLSLVGRLAGDASLGDGAWRAQKMNADGRWNLKHGDEKYAAFLQRIVSRYGAGKGLPAGVSRVKYWQFENEPDLSRARSDVKGFARLMRLTYDTIKKADPRAFVLMGGVSGRAGVRGFEKYYTPVLRELAGTSMDAFDVHYFGMVGGWKNLDDIYGAVRRGLDENGYSGLPVWMTECGTYSQAPAGSDLPEQTEREQAEELVKRMVYALGLGVKKVFWAWGLVEGFHGRDDLFDRTGLVYSGKFPGGGRAGERKLAYYAYKLLAAKLSGCGPEATRLELGPGAYGFVFVRGGQSVAVLWAG